MVGSGQAAEREDTAVRQKESIFALHMHPVRACTASGGAPETHQQHRDLQTGPPPPLRGSGHFGSSWWQLSSTLL